MHTPTITQLPYLGPHKETDTQKKAYLTRSVPFTDLHDFETERNYCAEELHDHADPLDVLIRKVEHLSHILGCSEAKAERILFQRIGSKV
jgi:hypothetical protein